MNPFEIIFRNFISNKKKMYKGHSIYVTKVLKMILCQAPEPGDIMWENLGT